jgi:hypothetical protein
LPRRSTNQQTVGVLTAPLLPCIKAALSPLLFKAIRQPAEGTITMSQALRLNDQGEHVRVHQSHLNDRLHAHGNPKIEVSGTCNPQTIERSAFAAWFLGALDATVKAVQDGTISPGVQHIIADPDSREEAQRHRAKQRRGQPFPSTNGAFRIVPCTEWGAVAPTGPITRVGRPSKIIFHHTDGHHPELDHKPGDTLEEAMAFARAIQHDHMHRHPAFIDSGHNFLVTRSGHLLEGRHGSLAAIKDGVMVQSAHCIGQNTHPGIEHEHVNPEGMTPIQRQASLFLHEFICRHTGIDPRAIHGHREFNATECPGALKPDLARFRDELARRLAH